MVGALEGMGLVKPTEKSLLMPWWSRLASKLAMLESGLCKTDAQSIALPAGRRSLVRLGVRPLVEGQLCIDGKLAWRRPTSRHFA